MLEESLTMESPDRIRPIAGATETQASPLFTYLCSLSPIKAVKSFHVPQTFLELSFPPPPTVFVSPNGDHKTTGTCRRRGVGRIGGEAIRCIRENGKGNTHSVKKQSEGGIGTSLIKEECDHSHHGNDFVEQYLADPVETEERESPLELVRFDTSVEMNNEESKEEHKGFTSMSSEAARVASDLNSRSFASGHQGVVKIVGRKRVGTFVVPSDKTIQTNKEEDRTIQTDIIDQSVSDFSVLLRGTADELSELQLASAVPYPQVSGFLATMREIFNEDLEGSQTNLQELSCDCKSELVLEVKEEEADMEASVDNQVSNGNHRGVRRRCLDFEAAKMHRKNFSTLATATTSTTTTTVQGSLSNAEAQSKISPSNQATADITLSDSPQGLGKIDEEHRALIEVLTPNMLSWRHSHADSHNTGESLDRCNNSLVCTSPLSVGMPSGIGLHLNSLAGALSHSRESLFHSRESLLHSRENTCGDSLLRKPAKGVNNLLSVDSVGIGSSPNFGQDLVVSLFEKARMDRHEVDGSAQIGGTAELTTCFGSVTLSGINRLDGNAQLGEAEKTFSPLGRKRVLLQDFCKQSDLDASDDSGQSSLSPKKKRKLPSGGEKSSDGCKRCNCKKSKCLKLYCECFAAGVYCVDSCSCRECFNKPEFEETVLGTRQQIESRNPLAFAPKIVRDDSSPTIVDEVGKTPASGRHKRGCNCKRSMCLKKYCECYQAGVGCSDSCRCEGCKNLHGRKEGSEEFDGKGCEEGLIETHAAEDQASLLLPEAEGVVADSNKNQSSNLSPVTPFQQPGRMRSSAKPGCEGIEEQFLLEKRPPSPQRLLLHCSSSKGDRDGTGVSLKVAMSPTMDDYCIGGQLSGGWGGEEMCAILLTPPLLPPRPKSLHPYTDFMEQVDTHQSSRITTETMPPIGTRTRKFLLQHTISSSLPPC